MPVPPSGTTNSPNAADHTSGAVTGVGAAPAVSCCPARPRAPEEGAPAVAPWAYAQAGQQGPAQGSELPGAAGSLERAIALADQRRLAAVPVFNRWKAAAAMIFGGRAEQRAATVFASCVAPDGGMPRPDGASVLAYPGYLDVLRAAAPDSALDRLSVTTGVPKSLITKLSDSEAVARHREDPRWRLAAETLAATCFEAMSPRFQQFFLNRPAEPDDRLLCRGGVERMLANTFLESRLRTLHECRQLAVFQQVAERLGYERWAATGADLREMPAGTYSVRRKVSFEMAGLPAKVVTFDVVLMPHGWLDGLTPLFFELKSAGDEANSNKRLDETKRTLDAIRARIPDARLIVFFGGVAGRQALTEAMQGGLEFVWEHAPDTLETLLQSAEAMPKTACPLGVRCSLASVSVAAAVPADVEEHLREIARFLESLNEPDFPGAGGEPGVPPIAFAEARSSILRAQAAVGLSPALSAAWAARGRDADGGPPLQMCLDWGEEEF